jgi:hypothetical protein
LTAETIRRSSYWLCWRGGRAIEVAGPVSCGQGWRRSRWPAKIAARSLWADCCCLSDDGHAQDFAFSRSLIRNGNCGICAGHAPWRLPASRIGMAHSARRGQVRQGQQTNVGGTELWPRGWPRGRAPRCHGSGGPVGGPVDGGPAVTVPGTVGQGAQPPNGAAAQDCQTVNGAVSCGNSSVTGQAYGGQLYFSNGTTATRYGDRTYFSDGTTGTTYGNKTYGSSLFQVGRASRSPPAMR